MSIEQGDHHAQPKADPIKVYKLEVIMESPHDCSHFPPVVVVNVAVKSWARKSWWEGAMGRPSCKSSVMVICSGQPFTSNAHIAASLTLAVQSY